MIKALLVALSIATTPVPPIEYKPIHEYVIIVDNKAIFGIDTNITYKTEAECNAKILDDLNTHVTADFSQVLFEGKFETVLGYVCWTPRDSIDT